MAPRRAPRFVAPPSGAISGFARSNVGDALSRGLTVSCDWGRDRVVWLNKMS